MIKLVDDSGGVIGCYGNVVDAKDSGSGCYGNVVDARNNENSNNTYSPGSTKEQ